MTAWIRSRAAAVLLALALAPLTAQQLGLYQWVGVKPKTVQTDLLTAGREATVARGLPVFRFYLGARFDYQRPYLDPDRFAELQSVTPASILQLPRYTAVLDDPRLDAVVLTVYESLDYGAGPDDVNLLRPFGERERRAVSEQIATLCRLLYERWGARAKTIILANNEADEKLMDILNHNGGDVDSAVATLAAWATARQQAVETVRAEHPDARLEIYHTFEISTVNLRIGRVGDRWAKTARSEGVRALDEIIPRITADLISYSSYESTNSPWETRNADIDPEETAVRLTRDLDRIRAVSEMSISDAGRRRFGDEFVMIGELGFARERFEPLPSGGVLPRLRSALGAAASWGCPYVVIWQAFDAPRIGEEAWGFGAVDAQGDAPRLRSGVDGCGSVAECLASRARGADVD